LKDHGEMEYFMGWLIIVEKKYKLHVISEFRWPIRPMVNSLKTRVLHALEIVLDEIYCYVAFFLEGRQTRPDLAIYSLFGWLIRWAGYWSARHVDDLAGPVLPAALTRGTVLPASQPSQPNKPSDGCIVVSYMNKHMWKWSYKRSTIKMLHFINEFS